MQEQLHPLEDDKNTSSASWSIESVLPQVGTGGKWLTEPLVVWATDKAISNSPEKITQSLIPFAAPRQTRSRCSSHLSLSLKTHHNPRVRLL